MRSVANTFALPSVASREDLIKDDEIHLSGTKEVIKEKKKKPPKCQTASKSPRLFHIGPSSGEFPSAETMYEAPLCGAEGDIYE